MNLLLIRTARGALGSTLREREREREKERVRGTGRERERKARIEIGRERGETEWLQR